MPPTFHNAPGLWRAATYVAPACSPAISPLCPDGRLGSRNLEKHRGVQAWPYRYGVRGDISVQVGRSVYDHAIGNGFGFCRHADAGCLDNFTGSAPAARHCENKTRDCQTHYRTTYQHRASSLSA